MRSGGPLTGFKDIAAGGDELREMIAIRIRLVASPIEPLIPMKG
jgi:hypothetical protein